MSSIRGRGRAAGVALVMALMAGFGALASTASAAAPVTLIVSSTDVGPPVAAGFVGLATEFYDVEKEVGTDPSKPDTAFEQVVRNLAPYGTLSLRIGGDSTDWTWWPIPGMKQPPWVRWAMSPRWAAVTRRLVDDLHAHLIVGINMEANSAKVADTEVRELTSSLGSSIPITFELGNEPELYSKFPYYDNPQGQAVAGRPKSYSFSDIASQWNQLAGALPQVRLAGPGYSALNALPYAGQFLDATHRISLLTVHTYPLKSKRCNGGVNLQESQLFEPQSLQTMAGELGSWTSLARGHNVSVRVDEMNSVTCGGLPNFSNTFGPALWALNILPLYAETGVSGVNFQSRPSTAQNLIQTQDTSAGWRMNVQPEYYGLMAFAQLTPPGTRMLRVSAMPAGLYAWAAQTPAGPTHVVVTNVNASANTVAIQAPGARGSAKVEALKAVSGGLAATGNIRLGGQTVSASTGQLTGTPVVATVPSSNGSYDVTVAPASAAIVTFSR